MPASERSHSTITTVHIEPKRYLNTSQVVDRCCTVLICLCMIIYKYFTMFLPPFLSVKQLYINGNKSSHIPIYHYLSTDSTRQNGKRWRSSGHYQCMHAGSGVHIYSCSVSNDSKSSSISSFLPSFHANNP